MNKLLSIKLPMTIRMNNTTCCPRVICDTGTVTSPVTVMADVAIYKQSMYRILVLPRAPYKIPDAVNMVTAK